MTDAATLTLAFMRSHPADAARVLETAALSESATVLAAVPVRIGSAVLAEMPARPAADLLQAMEVERALELLTQLDAQALVAILRQLEANERERFLSGLPTHAALTAKLLLEFSDDAVGSCMNPDVVALAATALVDQALDRVRAAQVAIERIFIVDDSRHLLGWAPLALLMRAPGAAMLETLGLPVSARLAAHAPLSAARAHPGWQTASTLPVVDRRGRLLGELSRAALERASAAVQPARSAEHSLVAVLAQGYWQTISGILELLISLLPVGRAIGSQRDEP